ncbi:MAG: hypothetical protein ACTJLK_01450 [Anaplasma sp.]
MPIVSDLLKFLEMPNSRGLGIPDEHRVRNILADVPVPGPENSCTIKVGNTILDGSGLWGTISFVATIARGETQEFFVKHATRALCNFCNIYLAPVFLSHKLDCVDGEQAFFGNFGELLKVSWQLYTEGGRRVSQRGQAHFAQYQRIIQDKEYRFFSMPGYSIAHSISEHRKLPVHELRATAMIHEDLLLPEQCIQFAQKNARVLRTMLQVEQALHTYRYLLTLSANTAELGCVLLSEEDLSWGRTSHYSLGVACVITTNKRTPESDKSHKDGKSGHVVKACISVCGGHMHDPNDYAFPVTAEGVRVSDIALHVVREDLECFDNVPAIFPYRLVVTTNFRANAQLMSRFRTLGILGLSGGSLNNSGHGAAFVVLKNEGAPRYSLSVLAKYIYLASSLLWPRGKKFAAFPGAMFAEKRGPGVLQNQDRWRGILLGHIPLYKRCTDISWQIIEEDLSFAFDCAGGLSTFKSTIKSFVPSVQTAALLNDSVVCAIVVVERIGPDTLQWLEVPTQPDAQSVFCQFGATSTASVSEVYAGTAQGSAAWSGADGRYSSTLVSSGFSTVEVRTAMSDNECTQQTARPQAGSDMPTNTQGAQAQPAKTSAIQEHYKMFCDTYCKAQEEYGLGDDCDTSDGGTVATDCPNRIPNASCAEVSGLSDTAAAGEAGPSHIRATPVQPTVPYDPDCEVVNPFETLERREQMPLLPPLSGSSPNQETRAATPLDRTAGISGAKAVQREKGAGTLSPARNEGLSRASYERGERLASISFVVWVASALAAAIATALYLGMLRSLCGVAYLAQCDVGVAVGLSCTVVFFGLLAAAAKCYLSQSPRDAQDLPTSSVSVVPAITKEKRVLHTD